MWGGVRGWECGSSARCVGARPSGLHESFLHFSVEPEAERSQQLWWEVVFGLADQWIAFCAAHSSLPSEAVCLLQVWERSFIPLQLEVCY